MPPKEAAHLRYAGQGPAAQKEALSAIIREDRLLMQVLEGLRQTALPDALVTAGAIYNTVWNILTGRPRLHGLNDIDVLYFDTDLSYEAEDRVIKHLAERFAQLPVPVQARNQARVHLWFPERFGLVVPPLRCSAEALTRYASKTHAVAARLEPDQTLAIVAPFGLDDLFSFRITPNCALQNRDTHQKKAARAKALWPELTVTDWDEDQSASLVEAAFSRP